MVVMKFNGMLLSEKIPAETACSLGLQELGHYLCNHICPIHMKIRCRLLTPVAVP